VILPITGTQSVGFLAIGCHIIIIIFLPRDATQGAVMRQYVVPPSVCLSVCNV